MISCMYVHVCFILTIYGKIVQKKKRYIKVRHNKRNSAENLIKYISTQQWCYKTRNVVITILDLSNTIENRLYLTKKMTFIFFLLNALGFIAIDTNSWLQRKTSVPWLLESTRAI